MIFRILFFKAFGFCIYVWVYWNFNFHSIDGTTVSLSKKVIKFQCGAKPSYQWSWKKQDPREYNVFEKKIKIVDRWCHSFMMPKCYDIIVLGEYVCALVRTGTWLHHWNRNFARNAPAIFPCFQWVTSFWG